jgi:hypothetical protein
MNSAPLADDHVLAVAARGAAAVCVAVIVVASLGPANWLPHLLYSNNLEHFAAFYVLALVFCAARYRTGLAHILRDTALVATMLEAAKWILPGPRKANFDHWMADLGGILAVAAPLVISAFRRSFDAPPPPSGE